MAFLLAVTGVITLLQLQTLQSVSDGTWLFGFARRAVVHDGAVDAAVLYLHGKAVNALYESLGLFNLGRKAALQVVSCTQQSRLQVAAHVRQ